MTFNCDYDCFGIGPNKPEEVAGNVTMFICPHCYCKRFKLTVIPINFEVFGDCEDCGDNHILTIVRVRENK